MLRDAGGLSLNRKSPELRRNSGDAYISVNS